ncbi:MAG TPA: glycerol acyltransferase [Chromatiales bacterium]|nr:glycerol acyltransferase [Thiotrichales bacterium]HIP67939.1 glycerol acyltransferase [Chromatiales bacterium]
MKPPALGPLTPRQGNALTKAIGRALLVVYRWRIKGEVHNAPKFVIVIAPHTSQWDFLAPNVTMLAVGFRSSWLFADAYDWWPLGSFMRWLGGIPIERSTSHDLVTQVVQTFNENDELILGLFPEGSRKKVQKWKTGFWYIAVQASVPIQLVSLDYERRVAEFGPVINPSDSMEADMERIQNHFRGVMAKYPDQFDGEYF